MDAGAPNPIPSPTVSKDELLEREHRWALRAAIASILAVVFYIGSIIVEQAAGLVDRDDDATRLISFHDNEMALLGTAVMLAIGAALLAVPLLYLFKAAEGRSDKVRKSLIAFAVLGPVLFGIQGIVSWVALGGVADDFVGMSERTDQIAEDLIEDSTALQTASGLIFPGILALLVGMIYIPLMAMRAGLITRFFGTLGMALGASMALFPPIALLGLMMWFIYIAFLIGDWLPGGRPPAWSAGVAVPWPKPGDEIRDPEADPLAKRGQPPVEGSGRELSEPPLPEDGAEGEPGTVGDGGEPVQETQGKRRKKRKRRR